ncbi:ABC transporter substrate-binding protein [Clostridium rectalis]|uniref:ABC transporter substrate-binding protein n=1 Tax=Clostridium rectalis TaxID=2040295 RepID=UPI000F639387|nr:ABC transporter substrate-binding protein [Clostridium rectalis]
MKRLKKYIVIILTICLSISIFGCGNKNTIETDKKVSKSENKQGTKYPLIIENYDGYIESNKGALVKQTFKKRPKRILSVCQATTEVLIALGLKDDIIATAHRKSPIYKPFEREYNSIKFLGESYPSKEVALSLEPDIIVGWGSLFQGDALGSVLDWHKRGINTYVMQNTVPISGNRNVNWVLKDIENLGKIFNVQDKAKKLIKDIKGRINKIEDNVKNLKEEDKPKVLTVQFMYENEFSARSSSDLTADIIRLSGATSLDDKPGKQSLEVMIEKNPDVILVINMNNSPANKTIEAMKKNPSLQKVNAVKNNKFLIIEHTAFYCGSLRTIDSIEDLYEIIHKK